MAGCDTCPEMVLGVLRQECATTLEQVRRLKSLATILNRAIRDVEEGAAAEFARIVALIPDPPFFDLRELVNLLTCPLAPQSVVTEMFGNALIRSEQKVSNIPMPGRIPAQLAAFNKDVVQESVYTTTMYRGVTGMLLQFAAQIDAVINRIYDLLDELIYASKFRWVYDILVTYMREVDQICAGSATFLIRLAMTSANAALIRAICPSLYERDDLPYKEYVYEMSTFEFDGILPGGASAAVQPFLPPLASLQAKIVGWQTAQLVLLA